MLRIRSQVLKLSVSLNAIGSEVGRILDKNGHVVSDQGRAVTGRPSPTDSNSEQATPPPPRVGMQMVEASEEETCVDPDGNGGSKDYGGADAGGSVSGLAASEWPAEASTLPQEDDAAADSDEPNTQGDDGEGRCMDIQDCGVLVPEQHDCLDFLSGPLEADRDEPISIPQPLVPGNGQHVLPPDLSLPGDTPFADWDPASNADFEDWMMSMFPPPQDAGPNALREDATESARGSRQQARGEGGWQREPSLSIPALPIPGGLRLPIGLFPARRNKNPHAHIQMQSRLSEHIETLEQYVRCKLDAAPERISRQG